MNIQEKQQTAAAERLARNKAANDTYIQQNYPDEKFISDSAQYSSINEYTRTITIPENVKIAVSRIPINENTRNVLLKELSQAGILAKMGNSVYLIPEHPRYKERLKDAIVNGVLYEFRTVAGNANTLEWHYKFIKREKGIDTNVFINVTSGVFTKGEAIRRIGKIIRRHPEYTGKIIMSFDSGEKTYFWDSNDLR